jgi:hypothetical protein
MKGEFKMMCLNFLLFLSLILLVRGDDKDMISGYGIREDFFNTSGAAADDRKFLI